MTELATRPAPAPTAGRRRPRVGYGLLVPLLAVLVPLELWAAPLQPLWDLDTPMPGLAAVGGARRRGRCRRLRPPAGPGSCCWSAATAGPAPPAASAT
jgi:hypothetical protein